MEKIEFMTEIEKAKTNSISINRIIDLWNVSDINGSSFDLILVLEDLPTSMNVFSVRKKYYVTRIDDEPLMQKVKFLIGLDVGCDVDYKIEIASHSRLGSGINIDYFLSHSYINYNVKEYEDYGELVVIKLYRKD